jgi:serine phosphatase RsbU (regulator of sigma subunit)
MTIPPGSRVLLFTDGLVEALCDAGDYLVEFGIEGVADTLTETRTLPVEAALARLFDRSCAFTAGAGRHDDASALLLERA